MNKRYYPIILVAETESAIRFKVVRNDAEYVAFCSGFVGPDTILKEIKSLEALYKEKFSEEAWDRFSSDWV
jgi:hypothetical protein